MNKVEQVVDAIIIKSFEPDPKEPDEGVDMVLVGIYISAGLVAIILILCIVMIV